MGKTLRIKHIKEYQEKLYNEEKSQATIEKYIRDIEHFYRFLDEDKMISKQNVILYKESLLNQYSLSSINSMLVALNSFLDFIEMHHCRVKLYKYQKRNFMESNNQLTKEEYENLLKTARKNKNEKLMLIMQTICSTGIRVSEHQYITVESIQKGKACISNKGKIREIIIPKQLQKILQNYCRQNHLTTGPVFITRSGKPLNRSNIWSMMKKLCQEANVDSQKVYPHNLRHLFALTYYRIEKNLAHLADILGHSSIETTRIYTKISIDECYLTLNKMNLVYFMT